MARKRKFNTVHDTITVSTTKHKHSDFYQNDRFLTYKAKNGRREKVVAILLAEGLQVDIGNLQEVAGDHVLNSRGYVLDGGRVYFIKENYVMNLMEFRVYLQRSFTGVVTPLTTERELPKLSETESTALKSLPITTFFKDSGDLTSLGRKVVRDVNASLVTYTQAGFRITDLSDYNIAVKLMRDSTIRFKLIVPLADADDDASIRGGYVDFLRNVLSVDGNSNPMLTDLINMLTPNPAAPLDFILERQSEDFETNPETALFHPADWDGEKVMHFFYYVNKVIEVSDGYTADLSYHRQVVRRFLEDMDNINLGDGVYLQNGINVVLGSNWNQIIHARSPAVGNIIDDGYPAQQHTRPLHLIRLIRNKFEHVEDLPSGAKTCLGKSADTYWSFFSDLFPHLLIGMYRVLQKHYYALRPHFGSNPHFVAVKQYIGWDKF